MFISENLGTNKSGNLTIGGKDCVELAKKFKTPLYVLDGDFIKKNCREFKDAFNRYFKGLVCYASKAFSCKEIYRLMAKEGLGIDVVSIGEAYSAISVGFPCEKIYFHGNNKTKEELQFALKSGIGRIVVDNLFELNLLELLTKEMGVSVNILLRIKPGVDAHVHEYIKTGKIDSKFGLTIENGEALKAVKIALSCENINLLGVHCHIGSQIMEIEPFSLAAEVAIEFINMVKKETGRELCELNLGGGFGVKYKITDSPFKIEDCMESVSKTIAKSCSKFNLKVPNIIFEPGRALVALAGITLYRVGCKKTIFNSDKIYVNVDGSMADNPRYALYKSEYEAVVANRACFERNEKVTIAGKCCESGDLIGENVIIQRVEPFDILAILGTGAYNYSMASNYNRNLKPAVILIEDGNCRTIVKRETLEDLVRNDL